MAAVLNCSLPFLVVTSIFFAPSSTLFAAGPNAEHFHAFECGDDAVSCTNPTSLYHPHNRQSVYFSADSAELDQEAKYTVAWYVEKLKANQKLQVTLVGYADDRLEQPRRLVLAKSRASTVAEAMLNMGVRSRQIRLTTAGEEQDGVAPCQTASCSLSYRRVEFIVRLGNPVTR